MKKLLGVLAVCLLVVGFVSCGEDDDTSYISMTFGNAGVTWTQGEAGLNGGLACAGSGTKGEGVNKTYFLVMVAYGNSISGDEIPVDGIMLILKRNSGAVEPGTWPQTGAAIYYNGDEHAAVLNITLTKVGGVGEMITGTFTGSATKTGTTVPISITNGVINLKHIEDDD
jgi:hypothetical protein